MKNGWDHSGLLTSTPAFFVDTNVQAIAVKFVTELARQYAGNSFVAAYDSAAATRSGALEELLALACGLSRRRIAMLARKRARSTAPSITSSIASC